ncbi:MAG TPA: hypothetical protein VKW09_04540 [bacterium]|nr:hypothetical protein [bacterium]
MYPLLSLQGAKINLEDALAAAAVLTAAPLIVRAVYQGRRELLWVGAFVAYMAVPFVAGLRDPGGTFLAVRELRPLSFYLLALAYTCAGFRGNDFRRLAGVYVFFTCVAAVAVFLQLSGVIELPGNRPVAPFVARYLEWSVPVVAFTVALGGALADETPVARLAWAAALPVLIWYIIAMQERTAEGLALGLSVLVLTFVPSGGAVALRAALLAVVLTAVYGYGAGVLPGPSWIVAPIKQMMGHWSRAATDGSMLQRISEFQSGIPRFLHDPLFGVGLGGVTATAPPDNGPGGPWRYMSTGYGFLLVKTGVVGLALYTWIVVMPLVTGFQRLREIAGSRPWPRFKIAVTGLTALAVLNVLHPAVVTEEGAILFSFFFGMIMSRPRT